MLFAQYEPLIPGYFFFNKSCSPIAPRHCCGVRFSSSFCQTYAYVQGTSEELCLKMDPMLHSPHCCTNCIVSQKLRQKYQLSSLLFCSSFSAMSTATPPQHAQLKASTSRTRSPAKDMFTTRMSTSHR